MHRSLKTWALAAALAAFAAAALAQGAGQVRIYKPDGTLQCGQGQEITLQAMHAELEKLGAKVIAEEKRALPVFTTAVCGAPTGMANTYVVSAADWDALQKNAPQSGFKPWNF